MKFIVTEKDQEYEFLLSRGIYIVGRDPTCDLSLDSKKVSRRHMSCSVSEDAVEVKDLGSRNGTFVGNVRVKSAKVKDNDEIRVGDVQIAFIAGPEQPAGAVPTEARKVRPTTPPEIVEEEVTPPEGTMVVQWAGEAQPQLFEQDGKWFVRDPVGGGQVEIVPAERAAAVPRRLFAGRRARFILAGAVAAVLLLLALGIYRAARPGETTRISMESYQGMLDAALEALHGGQVERAGELVRRAREGRPEAEQAAIVADLVQLWQPWQADFFEHWRRVQGTLKELRRYHSTMAANLFVEDYLNLIGRELDYYQTINDAKEAYSQDRYEDAWVLLRGIPAQSAAREKESSFMAEVRARTLRWAEDGLRVAAEGRDWAAAVDWATRIAENFPEERQKSEELIATYSLYRNHQELVQNGLDEMSVGRYQSAVRLFKRVPAESPHYEEAQSLARLAEAKDAYGAARQLYDGGNAQEALRVLESDQRREALELRRQIESVVERYNAARAAQQAHEYVGAQQLWNEVLSAETEVGNFYRREAVTQLGQMDALRRDYALRLVLEGDDLYRREQFAKARQLYERALELDPDRELGSEQLTSMLQRGRKDYGLALNCADTDTDRAIGLLTRACGLLPPEDRYYVLALDKKAELEKRRDPQD